MKVQTMFTCALVALILCAYEISAGTSYYGDIRIESDDKNGDFYCDGLICPKNTSSCEVTKRNDPNDFEQVLRRRKCLSGEGNVIKEELVKEPNRNHQKVNVQVRNSANRKLTPEEERQLKQHLDDVQKRIAKQMEENRRRLEEQLRPLRDGSFLGRNKNNYGGAWQDDGFYGPRRAVPGSRFGSDSEDSGYYDDNGPFSDENTGPGQGRTYYDY